MRGRGDFHFPAFFDAEFKLRARGEPNSNSGIFFHTDLSVRDKRMHLGKGYELNLNNAPTEKRKTGSLYAIKDITVSPVADETKWFDVHLIVIDIDQRHGAVRDGLTVADHGRVGLSVIQLRRQQAGVG